MSVQKSAFLARYGTPEELTRLMMTGGTSARMNVFMNPAHTSSHVEQGLRDGSYQVASRAAESPQATKEQLDKAVKHDSPWVRRAALDNINATNDHYKALITDPKIDIASDALNRIHHFGREHYDLGMSSKFEQIRDKVSQIAQRKGLLDE